MPSSSEEVRLKAEEVHLTADSTIASPPSQAVESGFSRTISAWRDGWRRVAAAPAVMAGVFVITFAAALPLALAMRATLQAHLGRSLMAGEAADGVNYDWWQEFSAQASGLGSTFAPVIIGFAATLDNVSSVLDGQSEVMPVASALALYIAAWTFISGGIIDRYARQRRTRAYGFFAAGGVYFLRFVRLALIAGVFYWWLFDFVHPWLFDEWYPGLTRAISVERNAFAIRAAMYILFGALLLLGNLVFDYTKIRMVVEDRRSALGAMTAALRFIARQPGRTIGLYALNSLLFLAVLAVWALVAPGGGASLWIGFAAGQVYVLTRLLVKLQFIASQTALFQASLAHARYTAAPQPTWPDSPAAEAVAVAQKNERPT